jgi:hypothetical protein
LRMRHPLRLDCSAARLQLRFFVVQEEGLQKAKH